MPFVDPTLGGAGTSLRAVWVADTEVFEDANGTDAAEDGDNVLNWGSSGGSDTTSKFDGVGGTAPNLDLTDPDTGIPAIAFTTANDDIMTTDSLAILNSYTIAVVFKLPTSGSARRTIFRGDGGSNPLHFYTTNGNNIVLLNDDAVFISTSYASLGVSGGDWMLALIMVSGVSDNTTLRINGQLIGKTTDMSPLDSPTNYQIGAADGNESNISISVFAYYVNDLDGTDQALLETYLLDNYVNITPQLPVLPPLTYLDITGSTGTDHSYAGLTLLDQPSLGTSGTRGIVDWDSDEEQLRLFRNGIEQNRPGTELNGVDIADYSLNETTKVITLINTLGALDRLLIVRNTRQDRPYVEFTTSARLKQTKDIDLFINQVLYIIQEKQEQGAIQKILDRTTYPDIADRQGYNFTLTGSTSSGPFSYSNFNLIRDDRVSHASQLHVFIDGVIREITTHYTVDAATSEVTLTSGLSADEELEIRRHTSRIRYIPSLPEGSSFSSDIVEITFQQIRNLIQESPYYIGLDGKAITNVRNPRRKTFITYSGPGDRFYYGNLPYYRDGTTYVWRDDVLITETDDYYEDDWQWIIDLINQLLSGETITISVVPGCPFPELFCNSGIGFGETDPDQPLGPDDDDDVPTGPSQTIPKVLVPVTFDSDTSGDTSALLALDGSSLTLSVINLHWDLSQFQGKVATAVTFGLYEDANIDATDTVKIYETTSEFIKVDPDTVIQTWDVDDTNPNDGWHVTDSLLAFVNTRLAADGHVYLTMEAEGALDKFTAWSIDGARTASVFGPHMSLEGALYPAPTDDTGGPVGTNQFNIFAVESGVQADESHGWYDSSFFGFIVGTVAHCIGGRSAAGGTFDPEWHRILFSLTGNTIPMGSTIHSALMTCTMFTNAAGGGSLSKTSTSSWDSFSDFLTSIIGPSVGGPGSVGVNVIDVTALLQHSADAGTVSSIGIFHHGGGELEDRSCMRLNDPPDVPTLFVDYTVN